MGDLREQKACVIGIAQCSLVDGHRQQKRLKFGEPDEVTLEGLKK
jgi:hypothetical protein